MDDFQQAMEANQEQRPCEVAESEDSAHGRQRLAARRAALQELSPTLIALARRLEEIRSAELERYRRKLGALDPFQHRAVEALTRGILSKILHGPVCELKAHAGAPEQHVLAQLVRRLFRVAY